MADGIDIGERLATAPELFTPLARSLPATVPFVGPEALERRMGIRFRARLGANESVFGPSPRAAEAMARAAAGSWAYGDPELSELREALAHKHGLTRAHISVGEGIDGLLGHLVRLTCEPGDRVVTSLGAYPTFNYHVAGHGARLDLVPYRNDHEDVEALIERARTLRPKLLYFANPDNPTGSWAEASTVRRLIDETPAETILVLDEAYGDFAPEGTLPPSDLLRPNLLRFRTFSKAYGMAGVRIGYVFGDPASAVQFDKVRNHFGVSRIAQAGALAALGDDRFLRDTIERVARARDRIGAIARANGLAPLPSATNFVAIDAGRDGTYARALLDAVLRRGVFIRMPGVAPLDRLIRVTVGRDEDLDLFAEALAGALDEVGGPDERLSGS
ncbi:pyridoxal phosphate-dependent aminotransferase [Antarcticirhabdus aurantiaca]|uniref:Pyridoxal phosphate-dependent aminotransferase n=1 Tax=Antarcticirhabdus aurantiaca TaxID=2606717 RepID=A0ACD4NIJ9_9HYPH|nr:pyridoxal phosphate-dependent aminotransferase [Antarcticirhabdus aurantiaca]WAJ26628.1 pyridoxal phosphate-dependent aminotransferase [Jeongeuplla avenae]